MFDSSQITVLIPTFWIPSCPDTSIIDEVILSVRERLPDAPIIIMCNGLRDELIHRKQDYYEYVSRLAAK